jgi:hypothetical protein
LPVRARRLAQAKDIADLGQYASSRNWVSILGEIGIEGARPAMTDDALRGQAGDLHKLLG